MIDTTVLSSLNPQQAAFLLWQARWARTARPAQIPPADFVECGYMAGRGFGKGLPLETPIPTPTGWTTMGDLRDGDEVFDEAGRVCRVVKAHDPYQPVDMFRITFSDGSILDADGDHLWVTLTRADRKAMLRHGISRIPGNWPAFTLVTRNRWGNETAQHGAKVRDTRTIAATATYGKRGDRNHCIPNTAPLDCPKADLPVPPYTLGVWLGDGDRRGGGVTMHPDDAAAVAPWLEAEGHPWARMPDSSSSVTPLKGLSEALRAAGLLNNKHVPAAYLRASVMQRLALLRGLMDTDGGVDNARCVSFSNTNESLVDAVFELAASLGEKPKKDVRQTYCTYKGKRVAGNPSWRVYWTPARFVPFLLPRKGCRITLGGAQFMRNQHRMIVSVEPIPTRTVRCITVDSPNAMYLAGRGMIPTHNTRVGAEWLAREVYLDTSGYDSCVIAPTYQDVKFTCFEGESGLLSVIPPELLKSYNKSDLVIEMYNVTGGVSQIRGFTAEKPERLRGPQHCRGWFDELAAWQYDDVWDMAMMGMRLGPQPQVLWTTTPKPRELVRRLTQPKPGRVIVTGSTFDNRANLPASFFDQLAQYEGTTLGRQELYGELIDPEESGIVRRSWLRLWPHDKPLPRFELIVLSLDTAYTEAQVDKRTGDPDPTACSVWGVFHHEKRNNVMLLDCWEEHLGLPDLIRRVRKEMNVAYGDDEDTALIKPLFGSSKPITSGRKPDILLIEDKGSGISLRQMLEREGLEAYAYNPGRADKLTRLHIVSPVFARRMVWVPESSKYPGKFRTWAEPLIHQLCAYTGPGSTKHDDFVDSVSQAIRLMMDKRLLDAVQARKDETEPPAKPVANPYAA